MGHGKISKLRNRLSIISIFVLSACLIGLSVFQMARKRFYITPKFGKSVQVTQMPQTSPKSTTTLNPDLVAKTKYFFEVMTKEEKNLLRSVLQTFISVLPSNLTYFLYGGTLLGSFRHHGIIPWDDDLDLLVRKKDKPAMEAAVKSLAPKYGLGIVKKDYQVKFYKRNTTATNYEWFWPFLDIFFYDEDDSVIWDSYPGATDTKFKKTDVFPLKNRPFMGLSLPTPKDTWRFLETMGGFNGCQTPTYNHKKEQARKIPKVTIACEYLKNKFPFVERRSVGNVTVETLVNNAS